MGRPQCDTPCFICKGQPLYMGHSKVGGKVFFFQFGEVGGLAIFIKKSQPNLATGRDDIRKKHDSCWQHAGNALFTYGNFSFFPHNMATFYGFFFQNNPLQDLKCHSFCHQVANFTLIKNAGGGHLKSQACQWSVSVGNSLAEF